MNVDKLIDICYNSLPQTLRQQPWTCLNHGYDVLDSTEKLNAYIASYGEMHFIKCKLAMQNFPFDDLVVRNDRGEIVSARNIEIFDWGCGQGIGTLTLLQLLHERQMLSGVTRVNLIEPSKYALNRASEWVRQSTNAHTEIRIYHRVIPSNDSPEWSDIDCRTGIAVHIFSNILDIREVGLKWLANTTSQLGGYAYYLCVGPHYRQGISRITDFYNYLGSPECISDFTSYPCGYTSRTRHPFGIEVKSFKRLQKDEFNHAYIEQSSQRHVDELSSVEECLHGVLSPAGINAYKVLRTCSAGRFDLFLRPTVGVERPDFVMVNISNGVVLINICDDIDNFEKEFDRIEAIKQALFDTYIKSLKIGTIITPSFYNSIKTGLFFTGCTQDQIESACRKYYENLKNNQKDRESEQRSIAAPSHGNKALKDPTQFLIKLTPTNCEQTIKGIRTNVFKSDFYNEIVSMIVGDWHSYADGDVSLKLKKDTQQPLVTENLKRLRVKGVAGSGKTLVLAHKAVNEHLRTGKKVLIVTYNISLIQYIRMRISQVPADFSMSAFEIINYHQFFWSKARRYYGRNIPFGASDIPDFFETFKDSIIAKGDQYDTIIIDEAQDYMSAWFDILQNYFLKPNGRFILFGDGEQNIYNREQEEDTKMPKVGGFRGRWREMNERISMRQINPKIAVLASQYALENQIATASLATESTLDLFDYKMGYWYISQNTPALLLCQNILWILQNYNLKAQDTVVLAQSIDILRETEYQYRLYTGCQATTTYESKEEYNQIKKNTGNSAQMALDLKAVRRVSKVHFTTNTINLKFATIPSFKGWEAKNIILLLQKDVDDKKNCEEDGFLIQTHENIEALIYTAITRARENLFILNLGDEKSHQFFNNKIQNEIQ